MQPAIDQREKKTLDVDLLVCTHVYMEHMKNKRASVAQTAHVDMQMGP